MTVEARPVGVADTSSLSSMYSGMVEFLHDGGSSGDGGFAAIVSGGSFGYTAASTESSAAYGGVGTGTTTTGYCILRKGVSMFNADNGPLYFLHKDVFVSALSDVTNSYVVYTGLHDSSTATEPTNGAYFEYDQTVSANWQCVTAAGGSRTKTTTSIPVKELASGADKLQVKIVGGVAKFWINNTLVHTESLTVPSGWSQAFGVAAAIRKTAGTTSRIMAFDMLYARQTLSTPRDLSEPAF